MAKMMNSKSSGAKNKVTGLKAKSQVDFAGGKDPKKVITGLKAKSSGVDLPQPKSNNIKIKAKHVVGKG